MANKYNSVSNVLSNAKRNELIDVNNFDTIDEVANMIKAHGASRGERRRLEKALAKTNKLSAKALKKAQDRVNYEAYEAYKESVDMDFTHFNAILGLVMVEDYHWKEDDTHDQITSLFDRFQAKMQKYNKLDWTTQDICKYLKELTGVTLIPDHQTNIEEFEKSYYEDEEDEES